MANKYENAENIGKLISGGALSELGKKVNASEKRMTEILKKLSDMESAIQAAKKQEEERAALVQAEKEKAEKEMHAKAEAPAAESKSAPAEKPAEKVEKAEKPAEMLAEKPVKAEVPAEKTEKPVQAKAETVAKPAEAAQPKADSAKPAAEEKPVKAETPAEKPAPAAPAARTERPAQTSQSAQPSRPAYPERPRNGAQGAPVRRQDNAPRAPQPRNNAQQGSSSGRPRANGDNRTFVNRDSRPPRQGQQGMGPRPTNGQRPAGTFSQSRPGMAPRPAGGLRNAAPAPVAKPGKNFGPDKKKGDRTYIEKEKRPMNKRSLIKQQGASVEDFDDERDVYRKARTKKQAKPVVQAVKIDHAVVTTDNIPIKVLSEKLGVTAVEITKRLFKNGIVTTVNGSIDYETAFMIAADLGIELEYKPEKTAEEKLNEKQADTVEEIESLVPRAPVVTVMGHVDHGKTSLLDYIRKTKVTEGEAGGITQHIGAYSVSVGDKKITFLDTPGHEAFTAMRARGAQVTDIVVLVVAADDGIMPQTVEAINHAKAAGVTIIVAVNKIDKPQADINKVKQDLTNYDLVPEEWGGDTIVCPVSAKTGEGVDNLLENILLVAEMKELLANPDREARGTIIEAKLDKGMGPMASVLVQNGTLHTGDNIISGTVTGRVRAMIDDRGKQVKSAGPSTAVSVLGFEEVPNAGDSIYAVSQELMKQVIDERKRKESEARVQQTSRITLDDVFGKIAEGNMKTLNLIIKGDVQGSVEAVKQSVLKLSNDEVQVKVIHSGAGAVTESDVMLADSSNAIILAFNVRPDANARALAERTKVDVRTYRIIYDLLDDMQAALKGMLAPKYQEIYMGKCEVRQVFKITGVGNVAGCYVLDGKIVRGGKLRIYRDDILVVEGNVQQLKRFKDDVKEVRAGFECGCAIEGFNDIKIGDIIECYMIQEVPAK
ncbi:MAG TPA: translation initiation factor IF-2 [Candidatus Coproplasma excrementavium]|nr:translation initiation factor IF-2 [Candidatus Coproplasma excrementavium]